MLVLLMLLALMEWVVQEVLLLMVLWSDQQEVLLLMVLSSDQSPWLCWWMMRLMQVQLLLIGVCQHGLQ
jgi:hypothetical protein